MICPYRKKNVVVGEEKRTIATEEYMPCYEEACPHYVRESKWNGQDIPAYCQRADREGEGKVVNK